MEHLDKREYVSALQLLFTKSNPPQSKIPGLSYTAISSRLVLAFDIGRTTFVEAANNEGNINMLR